jgi:alpha-1,2-mannosyltransferase
VAELFELVTEPSPFGPDFDLNFSSPKRSVGTKPLVTVRDEITSAKPYNRDRRKAITRNHSIAVFFNSLRRVRNVNGVYDLIDRQHEPIAAPISRHTKAQGSRITVARICSRLFCRAWRCNLAGQIVLRIKQFDSMPRLMTDERFKPKLRRYGLILTTAIVVAHLIIIIHRRQTHLGDFDISREFGRRFIAGEELYRGGLHFPYMPAAAMFFAPLAMINPTAGIVLRYAIAIFCLWLTLYLLNRMVRRSIPAAGGQAVLIATITLILTSHYIIRDLDDGGPHLILLALTISGLYFMSERRAGAGGGLIGFAIAQKATAALFIPFFCWKRNWRLAGWTTIATVFWMLFPGIRMGPAGWWHHQREWFVSAASLSLGRFPAAEFYYGSQRIENQALKAAVATAVRFFAAGWVASWKSVAVRLAPDLVLLALLALFCWKTQASWRSLRDPAFLLESSALMLVSLLLSPITWVQHLVFVLPALYLIVSEQIAARPLGALAMIATVAYALLALLLSRDLIGKANYDLVLTLHAHTIALLILLGILLFRRPTAASPDP